MKRISDWKPNSNLALAGLACLLISCSSTPQSTPEENLEVVGTSLVVGEAEMVQVLPSGHSYPARIDSGATTCSIHAENIQQFERDGKRWVRYTLAQTDGVEALEVEAPLVRVAEIKRHGAEPQLRPVVRMHVTLGSLDDRIEFTLTDRSKYTYPVLVGRNLLSGNALVDVSQKYIYGGKDPEAAK